MTRSAAKQNCYAALKASRLRHVHDNRRMPRRMLKKANLLTRPTPARQDAPFRRQGRRELLINSFLSLLVYVVSGWPG
jgi:hypothetical protein